MQNFISIDAAVAQTGFSKNRIHMAVVNYRKRNGTVPWYKSTSHTSHVDVDGMMRISRELDAKYAMAQKLYYKLIEAGWTDGQISREMSKRYYGGRESAANGAVKFLRIYLFAPRKPTILTWHSPKRTKRVTAFVAMAQDILKQGKDSE